MSIDRLKLSTADFNELASGEGGSGALAVLRAGQLNRRLLLLRALLDRARTAAPAAFDAACVDESYDLLARIEAVDADAVTAVLLAPGVGVWLAACLSLINSATPVEHEDELVTDLSYLATVAVAAAVRARYTCTVRVRARDGAVLLPTLGCARVAPPDLAPWQTATVECGPHNARVTWKGESVRIPTDHRSDGPGWQGLRRLVATAGGRRLVVDIDDLWTGLDAGETLNGRLTTEKVACWQQRLADAAALLAADHRAQLTAIAASLSSIVPLRRGARNVSVSVTSNVAFGAVGMDLPDTSEDFAVTLVHELAHAKLYALQELVPLCSDVSGVLYHSPWRRDPRPLAGVLHGAYAFLAVCDFYRRRALRDRGASRLTSFEFTLKRGEVAAAIETLLGADGLTAQGVAFVERMQATLTAWTAYGAAESSTLAAHAMDHQRLRWRLDNVIPDADGIRKLAVAWVSGTPDPIAIDELDEIVAAGDRGGGRGALIRLMRLRLEAPERFSVAASDPRSLAGETTEASMATAADVALVRGDYPVAATLYRRQLSEAPHLPDHWAGLALAVAELGDGPAGCTLIGRPEVVKAVSEQVTRAGAPAPDPVRLAEWLGEGGSPDPPTHPPHSY